MKYRTNLHGMKFILSKNKDLVYLVFNKSGSTALLYKFNFTFTYIKREIFTTYEKFGKRKLYNYQFRL